MIAAAAYRMVKVSIIDKSTFAACGAALAAILIFKLYPIFVILAGLFIGMIIIKLKLLMGLHIQTETKSAPGKLDEPVGLEYYI
ncbi:hypothetical protein D3C78_876750 [compost metagenome]